MSYQLIVKLTIFALIFTFASCPILSEPNQTSNTESQHLQDSEQEISQVDLLNAAVYSNRGNIRRIKKQWNTALEDFNRAIELNPNMAEIYISRGLLYAVLERWDDALKDFNRAIKINPNSNVIYIYRGYIYGLQQEFDHALFDLNKAISLDEQNSQAY